MAFIAYSTPHPQTKFSLEFFASITIADAAQLVHDKQLPYILPKDSISQPQWSAFEPTASSEIAVAVGEAIPCIDDIYVLLKAAPDCYKAGARSVVIQFGSQIVRYHFSKLRIMLNIHNQAYNLHAATNILERVVSCCLLVPELIADFKLNRFCEPLAGFHVTDTPLHTLGCLLNECWVIEDVMNARAELLYFRRAAFFDDEEPSLVFLATSFFNDCRQLMAQPNAPYSPEIIAVRERIRSGLVDIVTFVGWTRDHYSAIYKFFLTDLELGDSMHLPAASDVLPILRWALADLGLFTPPAAQTFIKRGLIDRQNTLAGGGSCGVAALNFIETRIDPSVPRWLAKDSALFRDKFLQDILLYHLLARRKTTTYYDWVSPCTRAAVGEVPGLMPDIGLAIGYNDFNLHMPSRNAQHPIYEWSVAILQQPPIFPLENIPETAPPFTLGAPFALLGEAAHVPPIHKLSSMSLDSAFDFPSDFGTGAAPAVSRATSPLFSHKKPAPIEVPDTPPARPSSSSYSKSAPIEIPDTPPPKTPPQIKQEVIDLVTPNHIDLSTPPRLATKQDIEALGMSPSRPSVKRKQDLALALAKAEPESIDLVSPPHRRPKMAPLRNPVLAFGPIKVGNMYDSHDEAVAAVFQAQEAEGHKWILNQTHKDTSGALNRRTLRCNRYRNPVETHLPDIDPSDWRKGKSGRTNCDARVALVRVDGPPQRWRISKVDATHNHERHVPIGGQVQRPPTAAQRSATGQFSDNFSRRQLQEVLAVQFPGNNLEPRQISNIRNKARKEARDHIEAMGGDFAAIVASLQELDRAEPGWYSAFQLDSNNVLVTIFWQSPIQAQLTQRYTDILINDNSYNRNDKQYPLSIGIVIDSHGRSRNGWYAFQKKEDTETHEWIFRNHLKVSGDVHPEALITDRSAALIASAASILVLTFHIFCLSHLLTNVDKNLSRVLAAVWKEFLQDFWACY
ncbi:hypothetical protein C8R47DRAFT_998072, partial [Mycena vitilis]